MRLPRWLKWEFWPFWLTYIPVYPYLLFKSMRFASIGFFTAANPGLACGGFVEYSKQALLNHFSPDQLPAGYRLEYPPAAGDITKKMAELNLDFPVILKPDIGERGFGVEKIDCPDELEPYLAGASGALLLQEYISGELEYGVMTVRDPGSGKMEITSLVLKEPLSVTGDGRSNLWRLIVNSERGWYHRKMLKTLFARRLEEIPPVGEPVVLVRIGSHSRGATFRDGNHLISDALVKTFDLAARRIPGFFLGRFDVKAEDFSALEAGSFKIMEVNGVNSEPAHIYDPDTGLLRGWRDLLCHWKYICRISAWNIENGAQPMSGSALIKAIRKHYRDQRNTMRGKHLSNSFRERI